MSARSLVQDSSAPAWLSTAARETRHSPLGHNVTGPAVAGPVALMNAAASSALVPQECVETRGVAGTTAEAWSILSRRLIDSTRLALLTSSPIRNVLG